MKRIFAVTRAHGAHWDAARPVERQAAWEAHADFMNALEAEGFVLLGGTLDAAPGGVSTLLVIRAKDKDEVRWRLAADPWSQAGLLRVESVRAWTLRLGEEFETLWVPARARAEARNALAGVPARSREKPGNARKSRARRRENARKSPDRRAPGAEKSP